MRPPAALMERLAASRLLPSRALPTVGVGERRSRLKGAGIEFIDHRPYREGDDTRHLDVHVMARSDMPVIREYAQMRQLSVTIFLDNSASMGHAERPKARLAGQLAQVFGHLALAAGDRVQVVGTDESGVPAMSPRWQGRARTEILARWVLQMPGEQHEPVADALRMVVSGLAAKGLVIVISDWLDPTFPDALKMADAAGQEILGVQILEAVERDPEALGTGTTTLIDAETDDEIEVNLSQATLRRYRAAVAAWQEQLASDFARRQWHFVHLDAEEDVTDIVLLKLRGRGIVS